MSLESTTQNRSITTDERKRKTAIEPNVMRSPNEWCTIYITNQDVSAPSLLRYSMDVQCWARQWWHPRVLVETDWSPHTHASRCSLSFLSIPPSPQLPSSNWRMRKSSTRGKCCQLQWQKKKSPSGHQRKREEPGLLQKDEKKCQKSPSLHPVEIVRLCFWLWFYLVSQLF